MFSLNKNVSKKKITFLSLVPVILAFLMILFVALFFILNSSTFVDVHFVIRISKDVSLSEVLLVSFFSGVIIAFLIAFSIIFRLMKK